MKTWQGLKRLGVVVAIVALCCLAQRSSEAAVTVTRGECVKDGKVLDANALIIENEYLKATITTNQYAGQMMNLIYKPTGQELAAEKQDQGYFKDRVGHNRYFWRNEGANYRGKVVKADQDEVVVETSYTWNYNKGGTKTTFIVSKTFTLRAGESRISCIWRFKNTGDAEVKFTPWMKHMGGNYSDSGVLAGPQRTVFDNGARDMGPNNFYVAKRGWMGRVSAGETSELFPMVYSVYNFKDLFQHFSWSGKSRHSLETIFGPVSVAPGKTLTNLIELCVTPSIRQVSVATPEIAAGIAGGNQLAEARKKQKVVLEIASTKVLGSIRIEGDISLKGKGTIVKLPHKVVQLQPGKIARVEYEFTPPEDGVYYFNLAPYTGQTLIVLGKSVHSQEAGLRLPVVVGKERPTQVVSQWKSTGVTFKKHASRSMKPLRLVTKSKGVAAGQFDPLTRIYPEDSLDVSGNPSAGMEVVAARNEWVSTQLLVALDEASKGGMLTLAASDLKGPGESTIPAPEAYEVKYVTTTTPSAYRDYPIGRWPDPLFRIEPKSVQGGDHVTYWFAFRVPKEAAPGAYAGSVEVRLDQTLLAKVPIKLRVRSFALPDKPTFRVNVGRVGFYNWSYVTTNWKAFGQNLSAKESQKRFRELSEEWWRICTEYGISPRGGGVSQWEKYMNHGRGLTPFNASPSSEDWLKQHDLLQYSFVYTPFDEHTDAEVPEVVKWIKEWKEKSNIPVMDCYYGDREEPLFGLVDIWCGQSTLQPWVERRKQAGDKFWSVNNSLIWFIEFEPLQGRLEFWSDFAHGLDGRLLYSNIRWSKSVYEKNWSTAGNYVGCTIYPAPYGLAKSIRLEAIRDGIEDYDYLFLLRESLNQYRQSSRNDKEDAAIQAGKIMGNKDLATNISTPKEMDALRERIAELIETLSGMDKER